MSDGDETHDGLRDRSLSNCAVYSCQNIISDELHSVRWSPAGLGLQCSLAGALKTLVVSLRCWP